MMNVEQLPNALNAELHPQTGRVLSITVTNIVHHNVDLVGASNKVARELVSHGAGSLVAGIGAGLGQGHGLAVNLNADHSIVRGNVGVQNVGVRVVVLQVECSGEGVVTGSISSGSGNSRLHPTGKGRELGPQTHLILHNDGLGRAASVSNIPVGIGSTGGDVLAGRSGSVCA